MNFKRFISKNKFFIFIVLASVILFIAYKKTNEGFQNENRGPNIGIGPKCNFNYCTGDYEVVTDSSGVKQCLKKCNVISPNAVVATSDPLICKKMNGTKVSSSFSRNFNSYKKLNAQGNNKEQCDCPSRYTYKNGSCLAEAIISPYNDVRIKTENGLRLTRDDNQQLLPLDQIKSIICPSFIGGGTWYYNRIRYSLAYPKPIKKDGKYICDSSVAYELYK
jgi:hypothetical protein